jgi:hypothetical protein
MPKRQVMQQKIRLFCVELHAIANSHNISLLSLFMNNGHV